MDVRSVLLGPGEERLRLGGEDLFQHIFAGAVALGLELGRVTLPDRGLGGAQAGDGAADGEGDDAERDAEREQHADIVAAVEGKWGLSVSRHGTEASEENGQAEP